MTPDSPSIRHEQKAAGKYLQKMRFRYQNRGRERKTRLLDESIEVTGYDRKYAIKLMAKPVGVNTPKERRGQKHPTTKV